MALAAFISFARFNLFRFSSLSAPIADCYSLQKCVHQIKIPYKISNSTAAAVTVVYKSAQFGYGVSLNIFLLYFITKPKLCHIQSIKYS